MDNEEKKEEKEPFDAIFCILDEGYASEAMRKAKEVGARGGTIIRGRGTGDVEMMKKYGIVITPEKEILIILAPSSERDTIEKALSETVIEGKYIKPIIFSLPVSDTVGLKI